MIRKIISLFMSCILFLGCGSVTLYAEESDIDNNDNQNSTEIDVSGDGDVSSDISSDGVDIGEIDNQKPVENIGNDVGSNNESQGTEVITWPDTDENDNVVEEDNDPSLSYSLYYENGSVSENVNSSDDLSTDVGISSLKIDSNNFDADKLTYAVYLSAKGWQNEVHGGEIAGDSEGLRVEAIYAKLDDSLLQNYDIEYRTYISGYGWTEWAKNGEYCGSKDYGLAITSIDIRLVRNDIALYSSRSGISYYERPSIKYNVHMQDYGWLSEVGTGQLCGKPNAGKRIEAFNITLPDNLLAEGNISVKAHVQDYGWLNSVSSGQIAGTTGQSKRVEAVQLALTGKLAEKYNILYQVYIDGQGWQPTKKNGATAGTTGISRSIQAIRISIQYKEGPQTSTGMSESEKIENMDKSIFYKAHVQNIGWQNTVMNYETAGTTGESLRVESLQVTLSDDLAALGGVSIRAHVQDYGWMNAVGNGAIVGTTGQSKRLEAMQMTLTGELANKFDICYRTHVQNIGWQSWKKNGQTAGTTGQSLRIEAVQIAIVPKSTSSSNSTAERVEIGVDVSSHQGNQIDWNQVSGTASFAIVRAGYRGWSGRVAEDNCAVRNVTAAKAAGMEVGLYFYSMATNIFQAMEEANLAADIANKCGGVNLPIYYDMEDSVQANLSKQDKTAIANAFMDTIHNRGYLAGMYSYMYWLKDSMDMNALRTDSVWVAQYNSVCTYPNKYDYWQYTSQGSVPGISGNVDMSRRVR